MNALEEARDLVANPMPISKQLQDFLKFPPLTRALMCEIQMIKIQTEIERLSKLHLSNLNDQMQGFVALRQTAIQDAVTSGIKQDDRAVLIEKAKNSPRKILAAVLKTKDEPLYNAVILAQEKSINLEKDALKEQKEMPLGVTEKCYKDLHGKGFDVAEIFEPVTTKIEYSVVSIEVKKIQDALEASKKAKKKELL